MLPGLPRKRASRRAALQPLIRSKRKAVPRKSFAAPSAQFLLEEEAKEAEQEALPALAVEACRSSGAVMRSWDNKVFPGEGKDIVSARRICFTGA